MTDGNGAAGKPAGNGASAARNAKNGGKSRSAPSATQVKFTSNKYDDWRPRQAIVVVHGMGEQRPVETLNEFSAMITNGQRYYSRPQQIDDAFDARMHVIPRSRAEGDGSRQPFDVQTDIYEYHWAHLMTGNRLDDLWPTFRRMMFPVTGTILTLIAGAFVGALFVGLLWLSGILQLPAGWPEWVPIATVAVSVLALLVLLLPNVPPGLMGLWFIVWVAVGLLIYGFMAVPAIRQIAETPELGVLLAAGGSVTAITIVAYLVSRVLPGWLVKYFADVVRYLDTSPRSYAQRRDIRKGIVDLLDGLQKSGKYDRIVVAAHSLGSYIAYDAISYLWTVRNEMPTLEQADVDRIERAASALRDGWHGVGRLRFRKKWKALGAAREEYRAAQRDLWRTMRGRGDPWLITDLVTFGSPMNFADRLFTRNNREFATRIKRREIITCPPVSENMADVAAQEFRDRRNVRLTWERRGANPAGPKGLRLHQAAPFAVVRWTNLWYPAWVGVFGDWFGGPLARLYGPAVEDVRLTHATPARLIPGYAHGVYLREGTRTRNLRKPGSFGEAFEDALDLRSKAWLPDVPTPSAGLDEVLRLVQSVIARAGATAATRS